MTAPRGRLGLVLAPGGVGLALLLTVAYSLHGGHGGLATGALFSVGVAAMVVDLVWSWVAVRRASVTVVANPSDAVVGTAAGCEIELAGARGEVTVTMTTTPDQPTVVARRGDRGDLRGIVPARGIAVAASFEVRCTRPFGLVGARRRLDLVPLAQPLHMAPRPRRWPGAVEQARRRVSASVDDVVSVRPYTPGDPRRLVHWPTTARLGTLAVRELAPPPGSIRIAVELGDGHDPTATEQVASGAAWVVAELLRTGVEVELATTEDGAAAVGAVRDERTLGRRLVAAAPGPVVGLLRDWAPDVVLRRP